MSRMLLLVPRMYTEEEFRSFISVLPDDFSAKNLEFWEYVEDKIRVFLWKIKRVYRDESCLGGEEALAWLSNTHRENYLIVKKLVDNGAILEATEDPILVAESESWNEAIRQSPVDMILKEMYQETIRERDNYVSKRIDETLLDGETGILFMQPGRKIGLDERLKIIRVCRFDPADYLRSWQVQHRFSSTQDSRKERKPG